MAKQHLSEAEEFEILITPHIQNMYRLAYRFTGNTADAEDLVQDVLVKIYPRRQEVAGIKKLRPWLVKILYRIFVDQHRREARSPLRLLKYTANNSDDLNETVKNIPAKNPGPVEIVDQQAAYLKILRALEALNADQQHLCILHDLEGYTLNELVDILNAPLGTLKSRLHRARAILRQKLDRGTL